MNFQIREIILYSYRGEIRQVALRPGEMNIISGASKRGKSSLAEIIDYCLGSSRCDVAPGVITKLTAAYALLIETEGGSYLIGRYAPEPKRSSNARMFVHPGITSATIPELRALGNNSDLASSKAFLSKLLGMEETELKSTVNSSNLQISIRHALHFVFQMQGEIANKTIIFHSQAKEKKAEIIRDVIPYFLGAVDQQEISKAEALKNYRAELRALRRNSEERRELVGPSDRSTSLLAEARGVGLSINRTNSATSFDEVLTWLRRALDFTYTEPPVPNHESDEYAELLERREELHRQLSNARIEQSALRHLSSDQEGFNDAVVDHRDRLLSLGLLRIGPDEDKVTTCAVCDSPTAEPSIQVGYLRKSLSELSVEIESLVTQQPLLQAAMRDLTAQIADIHLELSQNAGMVSALENTRARLEAARHEETRRAHVQGRIALYLDSVSASTTSSSTDERIAALESKIWDLELDLNLDAQRARVDSALSVVNSYITDIARELELEHSDRPVRLDIKRLTLVVDSKNGPIYLEQMGSGENWLGYHLATILGLHKWFIENQLPVPGFLVLDQPSQVYFPPEQIESDVNLDDEDHESLERMLKAVRHLIQESNGQLQVLLLEHADLQSRWYQDSIVERWREKSQALIPSDWLEPHPPRN